MARVKDQWTTGSGRAKTRTKRYGSGKRWLAVWHEQGREVSKAFATRDAADKHLARVVAAQSDGLHITKDKADVTVSDIWPAWIAAKSAKSRPTREGYEAAWKHLKPKWGDVACREVERLEFVAWLNALTTTRRRDAAGNPGKLGESSRRKVAIVMNGLLNAAVESRIILTNPLRMKDAPRQQPSTRRYLDVGEIDRLREALPADARLAFDTLLYTGVRPGEAFGFKVEDLVAARGRLRVARDVDEKGVEDATKSRRHREVPVGGELLAALESAADGLERGDWLLGGWTRQRWRPVWTKATTAANLTGLDTHELRHTAASLAIHAGANVKTIQRMLGHQSAAVTLDIYGHLWDAELDALPAQIDAHLNAERERLKRRRAGG